jgi:hypothetical protein
VKMEQLLFKGDLGQNPEVNKGDIILVPQKEALSVITKTTPYLQTLSILLGIAASVAALSK